MNNLNSTLSELLHSLLPVIPLVLIVLLGNINNFKKENRSKQFLMPIFAIIFCIVVGFFVGDFVNKVMDFMRKLGKINIPILDIKINLLKTLNIPYWATVIVNSGVALAYLFAKRIAMTVLLPLCKEGSRLYEGLCGLVYEKNFQDEKRYLKPHLSQGTKLMRILFYASLIIGTLTTLVSAWLMNNGFIVSLYYPIFGIIMIGEIYYYMDGKLYKAKESDLAGEEDKANRIYDYTFMRSILSRVFGDKLLADNTTVNSDLFSTKTNTVHIDELLEDNEVAAEAYGIFMKKQLKQGLKVDQNYLASGLDLLRGKSVIFNNPFYYDLIPYVFFPMNRTILRKKKVLIILGRHAIEEDVEKWCNEGLESVTRIPSLWKIGVLGKEVSNPDVGIITRSGVYDLDLHEKNSEFFRDVEFVMLIEPSRLVSTAQVGLNSIIRYCRHQGKNLVFCTTDKNCDGLVDALSHVLMTSLEEVTATHKHQGVSSYMCWEADSEHLQHRLLPNISRYLGMGTELAFMALKYQISKTHWFGGDAFPVLDMRWIAKQYYFDLLRYAGLPTDQPTFDEVFNTSANMWDSKVQETAYVTVEDESFNMYEARRTFSTRATEHGFINIISSDYLLKDYMAANDGIFDADSKAIPYIVADYAHTNRNVIYRLCMRLYAGALTEQDILSELLLMNIDGTDGVIPTLWDTLCNVIQGAGEPIIDEKTGLRQLVLTKGGVEYTFDMNVIETNRRYSYKKGQIERSYSIRNPKFVEVFLADLRNAEYVAEDEEDKNKYLGTELQGHIFQKYLPGQFFSFGGKYYEMRRLTADGRVLVRRASDHINKRMYYRQIRNYHLDNIRDSQEMGDIREVNGLRLVKQYADISVHTPAYWEMQRYNDFSTAQKVTINGVPLRTYYNKQLLKIEFAEGMIKDKKTLDTLALLMNEVFKSIYAENQCMVVAITPDQAQTPLTYSLYGNDLQPLSLYIIEDSQLDVGFLVSVERNLSRIFSIICDYLQWNEESIEESKNPKEEAPSEEFEGEIEAEEEEAKPEVKEGWFKKGIRKVKDFFGKIFKRKGKKKPEDEVEPEEGAVPEQGTAPEEAGEPEGTDSVEAVEAEETTEVEDAEVAETEEAAEAEKTAENEEATEVEETVETDEEAEVTETAEGEETAEATADDETTEEATEVEETQEEESEDLLMSIEDLEIPSRKPYHERYYLLYGGEAEPESINVQGVLEFLREMGYTNGPLEQARKGLNEAENTEKKLMMSHKGSHYCDFCGRELFGGEYEVLSDGRERCIHCSRTAVKTEKEFKQIYEEAMHNMEIFYGIKINVPIKIRMVNAKTLHKNLGESFVPTDQADGRILGVAIRDKRNNYTIMLENGSPRLKATMTLVHELTHIWQYLNWDAAKIKAQYGAKRNLEVYEGMAKWSEIQYAYLANEKQSARREEIMTYLRKDAYGQGFIRYADKYPLSTGVQLVGETPFDNPSSPL